MDNRDAIRAKLLKKAKDQINQKMAGKEIHIIKAVNLLSDLESISNLLGENSKEWEVRKPTGEAKTAFGELNKSASGIEEEKENLTKFIEKEMSEEFPNFSAIATPVLGAKLLATAGSKKRLCFMPASTIQILGAEKALFAHMRREAKSPKHGHLFNHPFMQKLSRGKRGKAARLIAGKLAIALKQDYFGGENTSKKAIAEIEKQIAKIAAEPEKEKPAPQPQKNTYYSETKRPAERNYRSNPAKKFSKPNFNSGKQKNKGNFNKYFKKR